MKNQGYKRYHFEEIQSTNDYAKTLLDKGENAIILASKQWGGRGTKGRSFSSNEGGVYVTKLDFYQNFPAKKAFEIMAKTATAVCKTLEDYSLSPCIKWPNDIYVSDKKICGILIENAFRGKEISHSIVGVGLNVNNQLESELSDIAVTMQQLLNIPLSPALVAEKLITYLQADFCMQEYLDRIGYLNKKITLLLGEERISATCISVDEEGGLTVEIDGEKRRVTTAEVSLRI